MKRTVLNITATLLFYLGLSSAQAETLNGYVIGVSDGDTLTVLDQDQVQYRIRLADIDAPEKSQSFGQVSKKSLSELCYRKQAQVSYQEKDQYGRIIGRVHCEGVDANEAQIKRGYAWFYERYSKDQNLYHLAKDSKDNRVGLWVEDNPTPPWLYRHSDN